MSVKQYPRNPTPQVDFLAAVILALGLLAGCGGEKTPAPAVPEVTVAEVLVKDVPIVREWVGTTDGLVNAKINAQVQGYLIRQNYQEGSLVKKGQVLFEIDPRPFEATLAQARGQLAISQGQLYTAKASLDKIRPLARVNAVSKKDLDDAIGREASARAAVQTAQAAVRKAEIELSFTKITSPITGLAGIAKAQLGELVGSPGGPELTTVSTLDPIKVYVPISEQEYLNFARQEAAKNQTGSENANLELILADGSVFPHKGRVSFADRQVDERTGTIKVAALFPRIVEALYAVHEAGIVHLNVKPHSVILCEDGGIRLVGFAAAIRRNERLQIVAGSPGYFASEQIAGKDLGPCTDVFSLGLLLREMLLGLPAAKTDEIVPLLSMPAEMESDARIPPHFAGLIRRMTRPLPGERFASCAPVLEELRLLAQSGTAASAGPEARGDAAASPAAAAAAAPALPVPPPGPMPVPEMKQDELESLFEPGAAASVLLAPKAPTASSSGLTAKAESSRLTPRASGAEAQPPAPPAGSQAMPSSASGVSPGAASEPVPQKIRMRCPSCGLVVRGLPEAFAQPIRCPGCSLVSLFRSETQEIAFKPAGAAGSGSSAASPAVSGETQPQKIHMQCPHCGVVVRGLPEVFVRPVRCPGCNVESMFKSPSQALVSKPQENPSTGPEGAAAPSSTSSGKIHMQCPNCGLVVRGYPYVFAKPIRCPDCNVESMFKPESQDAAPKSDDKAGSGWKKWGSTLLKRREK